MIRDPSDGSVRAPTTGEIPAMPVSKPGIPEAGPVIDPTTSGLPSASARDAERHANSRKWLADYRAGKINGEDEPK